MEEFSTRSLQMHSYRNLQQISRNLGLPSYFKREQLIMLINTKKFKTEKEFIQLLNIIKNERKIAAAISPPKTSKSGKHLQAFEASRTCNKFPVNSQALKLNESSLVRSIPSDDKNLMDFDQRNWIRTYSTNTKSPSNLNPSDRNITSHCDMPNYRMLETSRISEITPAFNFVSTETNLGSFSSSGVPEQVGVNNSQSAGIPTVAEITIKRASDGSAVAEINVHEPKIWLRLAENVICEPTNTASKQSKALDTLENGSLIQSSGSTKARPRSRGQRKLSAMSSSTSTISSKIGSSQKYKTIGLTCRNSLTQINTVLGECVPKKPLPVKPNVVYSPNKVNPKLIVQTVKRSEGTTPVFRDPKATDYQMGTNTVQNMHTGVKVMEIRDKLIQTMAEPKAPGSELELPTKSHAFTPCQEFGCTPKEISEEVWGIDKNNAAASASISTANQSVMSENIYNLTNQYFNPQLENLLPSLPVMDSADNTACVDVINTVMPNIQQASAVVSGEMATPVQENVQLYADQMPLAQQSDYQENMQATNSINLFFEDMDMTPVAESSQFHEELFPSDLMGNGLELINQYEDYLQYNINCFLCSWFGQNVLLEHHIRKEHAFGIQVCFFDEWIVTYSLDSLLNRETWLCKAFEYARTLYILSAKYKYPDIFMATINTLTGSSDTKKMVRMTVYNAVNMGSCSWEGPVVNLPQTMPYQQTSDCLELELTKMNILPNGVKVDAINKKLVWVSAAEAVGCLPSTSDIKIRLHIKLSDIIET